ncbi:unnamed protein product [Kluyveromyces dobzhanskii CBS 2104]|uniref:WGS project CCBQ000000000 data, contig 00102 n=1 Tax=Kluyveromyces dobzhanskii CBS 2104 TaxID=1427455 RepID=A0A0A8L6R6_9SACH|nr:unnamed protein product [Kluyveromyces dobzhanskii CBS 2104]
MSLVQHIDIPVYTPLSNANRTHKFVQLSNGITALLVSDPSECVASMCVSVATGSHNDPDEVPGLAHLCEHMIVSSESKKFARKTHYHDLLTEYNGNQNAFTTGEQTSFYFEIPNSNNGTGKPIFDTLVDVLASKLSAPVFHSASISKEIQAIDNEHEINKNSVSKTLYHGIRRLANPHARFSRFSTGSMYTLAQLPIIGGKLNLKSALQKYYNDNFVAENVSIVIRGAQSLHYLSKLVQSHFGDFRSGRSIKELNKTVGSFKKLQEVWGARYEEGPLFLGSQNNESAESIFIQSSRAPVVRLVFPISHRNSAFSSAEIKLFSKVWSDLFGDESSGSIHNIFSGRNYLNRQVTQLSKFTVYDESLVLQFELTNAGWVGGVGDLLADLFTGFIPFFLSLDASAIARYMNEWNTINLLQFLYQDLDTSTMERCSDLCSELMQCEDPRFILNNGISFPCNEEKSDIGSYFENARSKKWWESQALKFQTFVGTYMDWGNCRPLFFGELSESDFINSRRNASNVKFDEYYRFEYELSSIKLDRNVACPKQFQLPNSADFLFNLERNLTALKQSLMAVLRKSQDSALSMITQSELLQTTPRLINKNENHELWVKEENSLQFSSRSVLTVEIINMSLQPSAENTMNLEILTQLLHLYMNELLYPSERVGYMYQISANNRGDVRLAITINGFPQGVNKILQLIMEKLVQISKPDFEITKKAFRSSRVRVRTKYEEAARANSCTLASLGVLILLEKDLTTLEERLDALEDIDIQLFKQFCSKLWSHQSNYMNLVIQGDLSITDIVNHYMDSIIHHLPCQDKRRDQGIPFQLKEPETIKLPQGSNLYIEMASFHEDPTNSVVYFIETGERSSPMDYTMTSLFEYFMSMTLVPDLRIKKQIGYVVLGGLRLLTETLGIHISVISNLPPQTIESEIDEYLLFLQNVVLATMTESEFQENVLQKYMQLIKSNSLEKLTKNSGPANLMAQLEASVHSGNCPATQHAQGHTFGQHKKIKDEISFRTYNFSDTKIDIGILSKLTLQQFKRFVDETISISSSKRRKLSVRFKTPMTKKDIGVSMMTMQLDAFLRAKGFHITRDRLHNIVTGTSGNTAALFKELFHHFRSQGQSLRLCTLVLKEILKQILAMTPSSSSSAQHQKSTSGTAVGQLSRPPETQILSVTAFKASS